jgi:hypothetical protein
VHRPYRPWSLAMVARPVVRFTVSAGIAARAAPDFAAAAIVREIKSGVAKGRGVEDLRYQHAHRPLRKRTRYRV